MTDAEKKNLIELLDSLVMGLVPKATKVSKYGGTVTAQSESEAD